MRVLWLLIRWWHYPGHQKNEKMKKSSIYFVHFKILSLNASLVKCHHYIHSEMLLSQIVRFKMPIIHFFPKKTPWSVCIPGPTKPTAGLSNSVVEFTIPIFTAQPKWKPDDPCHPEVNEAYVPPPPPHTHKYVLFTANLRPIYIYIYNSKNLLIQVNCVYHFIQLIWMCQNITPGVMHILFANNIYYIDETKMRMTASYFANFFLSMTFFISGLKSS